MKRRKTMGKVFESNHGIEVTSDLNNERLSSSIFCDVTLEVEDRKFPVHRNILASISNYFKKLFTTEMREKNQKFIEIKNVRADIFESIISFIYTTKIEIDEDNVYELLAAANYFMIPYVKEYCTDVLLDSITAESCLKMWEAARNCDAKGLETKSSDFLSKHFTLAVTSSDMTVFDLEALKCILQHKHQEIVDEESAYKVIVSWVKHALEDNKQHFDELFHLLHLEFFSKNFLASVVAEEDLVQHHVKAQELLNIALKRLVLQAGQEPDPATSFFAFNRSFTSLRMFDIANCTQKEIAVRTDPLYEACAVIVNNILYLMGGHTGQEENATNAVHKLDLRKSDTQWEIGKEMTRKRFRAGAAAFGGRIYVSGGQSEASLGWTDTEELETSLYASKTMEHPGHHTYNLFAYKGELLAAIHQMSGCTSWKPNGRGRTQRNLPTNGVKLISITDYLFVICEEELENSESRSYRLKWYQPKDQTFTDVATLENVESLRDACFINGTIVAAVTSKRAPLSIYKLHVQSKTWTLLWDLEDDSNIWKMISFKHSPHQFESLT